MADSPTGKPRVAQKRSNRNRAPQLNLGSSFAAVTRTLKENQASLNEADSYNHNHGDNMVKNFQAITKAMREKKGSQPSEQLAYASQELARRSQSGSAQLYAQGLAQAASRLEGQKAITPENAMLLVQSLMGGQPAAPAGGEPGDALSGLMGTLMGGQTTPTSSQSGASDPLGGLLGSLMGGGTPETAGQAGASGGVDLGSLLTAGMAYMQASQQGATPMQAILQALMAGSQMNASPHHSQSGQLVAGSLLNTLGALLGGSRR